MTTAILALLLATPQASTPGMTVMAWQLEQPFGGIPQLVQGQVPNAYFVTPSFPLTGPFKTDDAPVAQNFYAEVTTRLQVDRAATYDFEVRTTSLVRMSLSGETMLNTTDGTFRRETGVWRGQYRLPVGRTNLKAFIMHNEGDFSLDIRWKRTDESECRALAPELLSTDPGQTFVVNPGPKRATLGAPTTRPGDRRPLTAVHPSFAREEIRGEDFRPAVGGMVFLPDGRLAVCTWDERGAVYLLSGLDKPGRAKAHLYAEGLGEPLGIAYWKGDLYVTQKGEITRLRDTNGDDRADAYDVVASGWGVSPNYHEFTFNLLPFQGSFYISSSVPLRGGHTNYTPSQKPGEPAYSTPEGPGNLYKIDPATGQWEAVARGLRTPNGMNLGVDGQMFVADNQGSWLPASPLYHIRPGARYLHQEQPYGDADESSVAVWFPHGEIGNSPAQMILIPDGPYRGQMLIGDVTHGGLKRLQLEKVNGHYQGAVYRHSQGLEAGINRLVWGPDGALYAGGIGSNGNWNHLGHKFGLERLRPTGKVPFEMLEVGVRQGGFQVQFTHPLAPGMEDLLGKIKAKSWRYEATIAYGGPKVDEKNRPITQTRLSPDRRTLWLDIEGLQAGTVVYLHLGDLKGPDDEFLWSPEVWYTLQRLPGEIKETPRRRELFAQPPAGAQILIGKGGQGDLRPLRPGVAKWPAVGDALVVQHDPSADIGGSDHVSGQPHGDALIHVEWLSPPGGRVETQTNGNSGIKLMSRYEIQIMNAPGIVDLAQPAAKFNEAGSIYRQTAPAFNPSYGAGVWQSYDIWFTAPRWEGGRKVANARATVYWNGVLVHRDVEITAKTGLSEEEAPGLAPLLLQDHQTEAEGGVMFRNVWLLPSPIAKGVRPPLP
ncbi:MAG: hypothetical protein Fur0036_05980 [Fimbriimonadaceae bacterium]